MNPRRLDAAIPAHLLVENTTGHSLTAEKHGHWLVQNTTHGYASVFDREETGLHVCQFFDGSFDPVPDDHTMGLTADTNNASTFDRKGSGWHVSQCFVETIDLAPDDRTTEWTADRHDVSGFDRKGTG